MSRKPGLGAIVATLTASLAFAVAFTAAPAADAHAGHADRTSRVAFHDAMRKLWEDHIVWTRQFIVSAATESGNLPDIGPTTDRLLANQDDIGEALRPFYGKTAAKRITNLLRDHILTAAELVAAAKAGDQARVEAASAAWYENANDIARALHRLNPEHWPLGEMKAHMREHLDLTLEEAVARLEGRYADDIAAYDKIHVQILGMADMLSDGIIAQFPGKFAR
jgi:hypothetical protein